MGKIAGTDEWRFRPIAIILIALFAVALICGIPGLIGFILWPIALIGFPVIALILLGTSIWSAWKRRFRSALSYLAAIAIPIALWWPIIWSTQVIHVGLSAYLGFGQLGTYKTVDGRFAAYDWSVGLVTNPSTFLLYDETDEIALPLAQHKMLKKSQSDFVEECSGGSRRLIGHYYICNF